MVTVPPGVILRILEDEYCDTYKLLEGSKQIPTGRYIVADTPTPSTSLVNPDPANVVTPPVSVVTVKPVDVVEPFVFMAVIVTV